MGTVTCSKCQRTLPDTVSFCTHCGTKIPPMPLGIQAAGGGETLAPTLRCHKCGCGVKRDDTFCTNCGVVQPDRCKCGNLLAPTARFCVGCGRPRPEDARPVFDMTEFSDFEDDMICKSCRYRGKMPVIKRAQSNSNPLAGSVMVSSGVGRALRNQLAMGVVNGLMSSDHAYLICPNCQKTLHWKH